MAKFRKKPVVVEAVQWDGTAGQPGVFSETWGLSGEVYYYVVTVHGQKTFLSPGDWIITEPDGEHHYPCKPVIFAATYEPAD